MMCYTIWNYLFYDAKTESYKNYILRWQIMKNSFELF